MVAGKGDFWQWEDGTRAGKGDGFLQARGHGRGREDRRGILRLRCASLRTGCVSASLGVGRDGKFGGGWGMGSRPPPSRGQALDARTREGEGG